MVPCHGHPGRAPVDAGGPSTRAAPSVADGPAFLERFERSGAHPSVPRRRVPTKTRPSPPLAQPPLGLAAGSCRPIGEPRLEWLQQRGLSLAPTLPRAIAVPAL